jgi:predicted membrane protein
MQPQSHQVSTQRLVITDILVVIGVILIPTISHVLPFPLYLLDPMRILVFAGYIFGRHHSNGLALALALPIMSSLIVGHPVLAKSGLISLELMTNLFLFNWISNKYNGHIFPSIFISILLSKVIYYICKYVYIQIGWIDGTLISTSLWIQLGTTVFLSLVMIIFYRSQINKD